MMEDAMKRYASIVVTVGCLLVSAPSARAQGDVAGRWEGAIDRPLNLPFVMDIGRNGKGDLEGTFGNPAEGIEGLPLKKITVRGTSVTFGARTDQVFTGTVDGDTMTGTFV